ncbi:substrate-binding periplasmic protein [Kiloniella sp.]|uniref:substrate-binding periplasmic protein n=1 Tax=Kiloniella sp. TaxID=1938587 RepID=UPI003B020C2B
MTSIASPVLAQEQTDEVTRIQIVTDGFAPLQYLKDGKPDGYVTEFIQATIERVKVDYPLEVLSFEFLPWKRALHVAKNEPNTLFFSLSRTPEREGSYQWLETVSPYRQSFYRLKSNSHIIENNFDTLRDGPYILGIQRGGSVHSLVDQYGFESGRDYTTYTHFSQGIKMLYHGRIDMLPLTDFLARNAACRTGFNGDFLTPVIAITSLAKPLWATLSNSTDPHLVAVFKKAMTELKSEGVYQEILDKHLVAWSKQPCKAE